VVRIDALDRTGGCARAERACGAQSSMAARPTDAESRARAHRAAEVRQASGSEGGRERPAVL